MNLSKTILAFTKKGPVVIVPEVDFGRYCVRCGEDYHGTYESQPHLCKDVQDRFEAFLAEERDEAFRWHQSMLLVLGGEA